MKKRIAIVLTILLIFSTFLQCAYALEQDDAEVSSIPQPVRAPWRSWYIGGNYSYGEGNKPVLVFVHGAASGPHAWFSNIDYYGYNTMYELAYRAGYRTAFIDKGSDSNWICGQRIANQLADICAYFGVSKVNVICHSKGGIDTNTAIAFYGAYNNVNNVITLATPHWGSRLADVVLLPTLSIVSRFFGQGRELFTLTTGNMAYYRFINQTVFSNDYRVSYFTLGGISKGPDRTMLRMTGELLFWLTFQNNDGLVPLYSSYKPYSRRIATNFWDHSSIIHGGFTWSWIAPYVSARQRIYDEESADTYEIEDSDTYESAPITANSVYRGDFIDGSAEALIPVDNTVIALSLDILTTDENVEIKLIQPDGSVYVPNPDDPEEKPELQILSDDTDVIFRGAIHNLYKIKNPMHGKWIIKLTSEAGAAYGVIANYDSDCNFSVNQESLIYQSRQEIPISIDMSQAMVSGISNLTAAAIFTKASPNAEGSNQIIVDLTQNNNCMAAYIQSNIEPGLYSVEIVAKGTATAGLEFERSAVYTIVVTPDGEYDPIEFAKSIVE